MGCMERRPWEPNLVTGSPPWYLWVDRRGVWWKELWY